MNWMKWEDRYVNMDSFIFVDVNEISDTEYFIYGWYGESSSGEQLGEQLNDHPFETREEAEAYLDSQMRDFYGLSKQ